MLDPDDPPASKSAAWEAEARLNEALQRYIDQNF